jgi:anti-anti-sigma regulatory factor
MSTATSPVTILVNEGIGVRVAGTLDATTVGNLNRTVDDFLARTRGLELLELDLRAVERCDESVLVAVRHARAVCTEHSMALRVIPSDSVRHAICPR